MKKNIYIYIHTHIHITESLRCIPETDTYIRKDAFAQGTRKQNENRENYLDW